MASDIQEYSVSINFTSKGSESTEQKVKSLQDKIDNLKKGNKKSLDFSSLGKGLASGLSNVSKLLSPLGKVMGAVFSYKTGQQIGSMTKKMYDYIETVNLFRASMGEAAGQATEFINKAEDLLGLDPGKMMNAVASFYNLSQGFGIASDRAYLMSQNLTQLSGDLSSFANISFEAAQKKLMSGFSGQVLPLRQYGIALDQVSLQELAYSLGIEKRVKAMTRAEKTELIYYQIMKSTQKIQGDLGRSIIAPANAVRVMKTEFEKLARSIGSIFIPGMMAIIPVVRAVTRALTSAAKAIAEFFGFKMENYEANMDSVGNLLSGVSGGIDDIGESADGTAKALNKMLMPFDELNNITLSAGSGGAGGGLDDLSGGTLGLDLPTYDMFESLDERFKEMLENGNWVKIAETWANKINETLGKIPWDKIKEGASKFGSQLAEFLNIGIKTTDWKLIGETLAESINTAFEFLYNFLTEFDFIAFGKAIANFIEGAIGKINWTKLANTISTGIKGLLDGAVSFIYNLPLDKIEQAIVDFVFGIDWEGIITKLTKFLSRAIIKSVEFVVNTGIKAINQLVEKYPILMGSLGIFNNGKLEEISIDDSFLLSTGAYSAMLQDIEEDTAESLKNTKKTVENFTDSTLDNFNTLSVGVGTIAADTMINCNKSIVEGSSETNKIFNKLKEDIIKALDNSNEATNGANNTMQSYNTTVKAESTGTMDILNRLRLDISAALNNNSGAKTGATETMQTYSNTIETQSSGTRSALDRLRADMNNALNNRSGAQSGGSNTIGGYNEGIESQQNNTRYATNLIKRILSGELDTPSDARKWGSDMIDGLIKGIQDRSPAARAAITSVANVISKVIHFSRPDEGPLRDYETWMPDMMEGLSKTLVASIPTLNSALYQVADTIAESIRDINIPDMSSTMFIDTTSEQIIGQIGSNATRAVRESSTNYATETYEAIGRALAENAGNNRNQIIQVNVGNKRLYEGYGTYKDEESKMLGVNI